MAHFGCIYLQYPTSRFQILNQLGLGLVESDRNSQITMSKTVWFSYVSTIPESKWFRLPWWFCSKCLEAQVLRNQLLFSLWCCPFLMVRDRLPGMKLTIQAAATSSKAPWGAGRKWRKIYPISRVSQTTQIALWRKCGLYVGWPCTWLKHQRFYRKRWNWVWGDKSNCSQLNRLEANRDQTQRRHQTWRQHLLEGAPPSISATGAWWREPVVGVGKQLYPRLRN